MVTVPTIKSGMLSWFEKEKGREGGREERERERARERQKGRDLAEEHVFERVERARVFEVVERFIRLHVAGVSFLFLSSLLSSLEWSDAQVYEP